MQPPRSENGHDCVEVKAASMPMGSLRFFCSALAIACFASNATTDCYELIRDNQVVERLDRPPFDLSMSSAGEPSAALRAAAMRGEFVVILPGACVAEDARHAAGRMVRGDAEAAQRGGGTQVVHTGPRGGRYVHTASGKKRYVKGLDALHHFFGSRYPMLTASRPIDPTSSGSHPQPG